MFEGKEVEKVAVYKGWARMASLKFPFELRYRGGMRMGHLGEGHCSQWSSKYKVFRVKFVNLFEGSPRYRRKQG